MFRFIRTQRFDRILLRLSISVLTLVALLYVWTNWSGSRRWAAVKAQVEGEGETLEFRKLLPETVPEKQNLLAIEPLRDIAAIIDNDDQKGEPGVRRKALEKMKWSGATPPMSKGVTLGSTTGFQEWVKFLREAKYLELPSGPEVPGGAVLAALDAKFPLLKQVADETANRPLAMFTPGLREREIPDMLFALRLPHYNAVQGMAKALALRARAAVAAGAGAEAARSIVALHRLAQACAQEPLLIGFLVGNSFEMQALEPLWLGMRERMFAEGDLQLLQSAYAAEQTREAQLCAMRGELATGVNAVDFLQRAARGEKTVEPDLLSSISPHVPSVNTYLWRLLPGGVFDHWKSVIVELELRHWIQPLKRGGLAEAVRQGDAAAMELEQKSNLLLHPDHLIARLMLPAVSQINGYALLQEARMQQVVAALALERFYGKHARYPAALTELTPEFVPAVPLDPCDGKALRYRTTAAGRYQLWSVGFDGKDDGGQVTVDKKGAAKLTKRDYLGDWTWQYEPAGPVKAGAEK